MIMIPARARPGAARSLANELLVIQYDSEVVIIQLAAVSFDTGIFQTAMTSSPGPARSMTVTVRVTVAADSPGIMTPGPGPRPQALLCSGQHAVSELLARQGHRDCAVQSVCKRDGQPVTRTTVTRMPNCQSHLEGWVILYTNTPGPPVIQQGVIQHFMLYNTLCTLYTMYMYNIHRCYIKGVILYW
jgi:hypothetical protein